MSYTDLPRPQTPSEQIDQWILETLDPEVEKLKSLRAEAVHKGVLHEMGNIASGLLMEIGRYVAMADRELTRVKAQETKGIHATAQAVKDQDKTPTPNDVVKTEIQEAIATWKQKVDFLKNMRDALEKNLSFFQTSIRQMRDEEFTQFH